MAVNFEIWYYFINDCYADGKTEDLWKLSMKK